MLAMTVHGEESGANIMPLLVRCEVLKTRLACRMGGAGGNCPLGGGCPGRMQVPKSCQGCGLHARLPLPSVAGPYYSYEELVTIINQQFSIRGS